MAFTFHKDDAWSGARSVEYAGTYNVMIDKESLSGMSKGRGLPTMTLHYIVIDGEQEGRSIMYDTFVDDSAAGGKGFGKIATLLEALNVSEGYTFDGDGLTGVVAAVGGQMLNIDTEWQEVTQGKSKGSWNLRPTAYGLIDSNGSKSDLTKPRPEKGSATPTNATGVDPFANSETAGADAPMPWDN